MEITKRSEARKEGIKRFFSGVPCVNGHTTYRLVVNGTCVECSRINCLKISRKKSKLKKEKQQVLLEEEKNRVKRETGKSIVTKNEAKILGINRFFTGKKCSKGHVCDRRLSDGKCIKCTNTKDRLRRETQNKDEFNKYTREYYKKNKEVYKAIGHRRRAALLKAKGGNITKTEIINMLKEQGFKCLECSIDVSERYHLDHIMPLSKGGNNSLENIQILCPSCNCSKGAKTPREWKEYKNDKS